MQCRNNGESKSGTQKKAAAHGDPRGVVDFEQEHKKYGSDLGESVGFTEDAGTEIAQSGDGVEHGAGGKNGNVATENDHGEFPGNFMQDRQHQKHGAEQKLVGDGIEVLSQHGLLLESAGKQAVEPIAEPGQHK